MSDLLPCTDIITEIVTERRRQTEVEGWTPGHDDAHTDGSLAQAAACYAVPGRTSKRFLMDDRGPTFIGRCPANWPLSWSTDWWKPKNKRRDLIRAAALLVAEIERLDRAQDRASNPQSPPGGATDPAIGNGVSAAPVRAVVGCGSLNGEKP